MFFKVAKQLQKKIFYWPGCKKSSIFSRLTIQYLIRIKLVNIIAHALYWLFISREKTALSKFAQKFRISKQLLPILNAT